jgi:hypothetical protein
MFLIYQSWSLDRDYEMVLEKFIPDGIYGCDIEYDYRLDPFNETIHIWDLYNSTWNYHVSWSVRRIRFVSNFYELVLQQFENQVFLVRLELILHQIYRRHITDQLKVRRLRLTRVSPYGNDAPLIIRRLSEPSRFDISILPSSVSAFVKSAPAKRQNENRQSRLTSVSPYGSDAPLTTRHLSVPSKFDISIRSSPVFAQYNYRLNIVFISIVVD